MSQLANRVKETTTTTGTGPITLAGASTGYASFTSNYGIGQSMYYTIAAGAEWEVGVGTMTSSTVMARSSVISSSNSNGLVSFAAGSKDVFVTAPAEILQNIYIGDVDYATKVALPTVTPTGAGATKTLTTAITVALNIDGNDMMVGDRVLVKNQLDAVDNGVYTVTQSAAAVKQQIRFSINTISGVEAALDGAYIAFSSTSVNYYVWFNWDSGANPNPAPGGLTQIGSFTGVAFATGASTTTVAKALSDYINLYGGSLFDSYPDGNEVVITARVAGLRLTAASATNASAAVSVSTVNPGANAVVQSNILTRAYDFLGPVKSDVVSIRSGSTNSGTNWGLTNTGPITIDKTGLNFSPVGAPASAYPFHPRSGRARIVEWHGGNTTAAATFAATVGAFSYTGASPTAPTIPTLSNTNVKTRTHRSVFGTNATAGSIGYIRANHSRVFRGNAADVGGYCVTFRWGDATLSAQTRRFVGLYDTVANPTNIDLLTSTTPGRIGVYSVTNSGNNRSLIHNLSGNAPTVINLGSSFAVNTNDLYELTLSCFPNDNGVYWRVVNVSSGVEVTGKIVTNQPNNTSFLNPVVWMCNNTDASINQMDFVSCVIDTES